MKQSGKKGNRFPVFQERLRQAQGELSNTDFAKKLGMSRQTIGFYLNGDRLPDILALRTIAEVCGVTADWLIGLTDTPERTPAAVDELGLSPGAVTGIKSLRNRRFRQTHEYPSFYVAMQGKSVDEAILDATSPIEILNSALEDMSFLEALYNIGYASVMRYVSNRVKRVDIAAVRTLAEELSKHNMCVVGNWTKSNDMMEHAFQSMSRVIKKKIWKVIEEVGGKDNG